MATKLTGLACDIEEDFGMRKVVGTFQRGLLAAFIAGSSIAVAEGIATELILLGTGGGQRIFEHRSQTSQALVRGGSTIVIDTGFNAARQLAWAGIDASSIDFIFITHDHPDHTQHIGRVLHAAWSAGRTTPIDVYSFPGIEEIIDTGLSEIDIGSSELAAVRRLAVLHDVTEGGVVHEDGLVKVTAAENSHGMEYSYGYRFDMPDRSIAFSGDTAYDEAIIELARGADVLVHGILYMPWIEETIVAAADDPDELRRHVTSNHTPAERVGEVAVRANVGMLVISHVAPTELTANDEHLLVDIIQQDYSGPLVIGRDLMRL